MIYEMNLNIIEIQSILNGSYLYILLILVVLLTILLLILKKNLLKTVNGLGVILGISGLITISISYVIPVVLNILSENLSKYMMIINPVVDTFREKLLLVGLSEIIFGTLLFIITFVIIWKKENNESKI